MLTSRVGQLQRLEAVPFEILELAFLVHQRRRDLLLRTEERLFVGDVLLELNRPVALK